MKRSLLLVLFACALFVSIGAAVSIGGAAGTSDASAFAQQDIDPDDILMSVAVEDDGDAVWTIEYRTRLDTDEDEEAFEDLRNDIRDDPEPYVERFSERMEATAAAAADATGREMTIEEMTVSAEKRELPREYGVVTYSFRWSNFAASENDRLYVGDAIDGLFLDEETALLVSWSDSYDLLGASPTPSETRESAVIYQGPTTFSSGEPRVELGPPEAAPPADGDQTDPAAAQNATVAIVLVVLAGGLLGGAVIAYRRRRAAPTEAKAGDEGENEPIDSELLSNEEQVLRLIEEEGGRIKQQEIAERLGWTDAKTSQVTKKLREEGELDGFRLGRENVLSLPEEDTPPDVE